MPSKAGQSLAFKLVLLLWVFGGGRGQVVAPHVVMLEGNCGWEDSRGARGTENWTLALANGWRMKMEVMMRMGWLISADWQHVHICLLRKLQKRTESQSLCLHEAFPTYRHQPRNPGHVLDVLSRKLAKDSQHCSVDWTCGSSSIFFC